MVTPCFGRGLKRKGTKYEGRECAILTPGAKVVKPISPITTISENFEQL